MAYSGNRFLGKDMSRYMVVGYGLSRNLAALVRKASKAVGVDFFPTNVITDVLVMPGILLVCDFSRLGRKQLEFQYECMTEVNLLDPDFRWVLLGEQQLVPPKALRARALFPEPLDEQALRVIMLRQLATIRRVRKKTREYDQRLHRLLSVLKQLRIQRVVKSKDLCIQFNVNARTIARDMRLLQEIGEMVEYDPNAKAYHYLLETPWPGGH